MYHQPALLQESIEGLNINPEGVYVDLTFGGGGHSKEILKHLSPKGRLIAFDQDADAQQNIQDDARFIFVDQNFKYLKNFLRYYNALPVDGILADLGISSYQIDTAARGFATRFDGPLDMRMSQNQKFSAQELVNTYSQEALKEVFEKYGEIDNASKLASQIVLARAESQISTTAQFKETIRKCTPKHQENKYLAQVFQAIRIEINDEMEVLKNMLLQTLDVLKVGGRLAVISYHSLEDRLVKNFMKTGNFEGELHKDFYGKVETPWQLISRKPIIPNEKEIDANPRARSAKLRVAEKKA